ncbi:MAG: diguanylate cyclase [Acidobacteria bacterium]|nr:diguanylate cyclase [Acidobacteriota bacterium]
MLAPEALTMAFVNAASDYLVVLDLQSRLVFANKAFRNAFLEGKEPSNVQFVSLVDSTSAPRGLHALSELEAGPRQVELYHYTSEGKVHPVHYLFCRMNLEERQLVAGVGRDKTPDLELLGEITQLNITLEKKQRELEDAYARLEQLAVTDQVTGLYNRHHFFTVVQHFLEESRRYGLPLSCLMLDLDNFKSVNDHYGHIFGDYVLKMLAERFRNNTRKSDLVARYGGEEFVLVTPSTDIRTAQVLGERIRAAVEREPFTLGNVTANVTVSVGISGTELITKGPFDYLLDSSDRALYIAKHGGRNRVVIYSPETGAAATQQ